MRLKMLVLLLVAERKKESQISLQLLGFEGGPGLGLNQRPPDYESGATNRLSGASHDENQRVIKP